MSFNMSLAQYGLGLIGTIFSWFLMIHMGRRTLFIGGLGILMACLLTVGFISIAPRSDATSWATGSMLLVYTFFYDSTIGPVVYSLVSELSSTRLRAKSVVLSRNLYNIFGIINGIMFPNMLNPTAWNWGAKSGFFWAGCCFLCWLWTFFSLPEPKGRTYAELDVRFETGVSARKVSSTKVDIFHGSGVEKVEVVSQHQEHKE
jgi:SP family general alpha glucoside:H+ symporter-like MFS transporter